jgi:hypothetical protein
MDDTLLATFLLEVVLEMVVLPNKTQEEIRSKRQFGEIC